MVLAYKRYKQDTETVAGWLAETAANSGYKSDTAINAPKEPKLKGRARKLARDAAKQSPNNPRIKHTYTVHTTQFVELASQIVKAQPKVILTRTLRGIWERAIRARRRFCDWFQSKASTSTLSDEKHSHFAAVLEAALQILKPCWEDAKESVPSPKTDTRSTNPPHDPDDNMFRYLEVEETVSDEESEGKKETTTAPSSDVKGVPQANIVFDDDKEEEDEFIFAVWSLLQDVMAVRVYVASTWQRYSVGRVELMQAASVTNLAVDLIRRAEADFEACLQRPSKYPAAKYPTGLLPYLIFKLHLPGQNGGPLDFDPDVPCTIAICGCPICNFLLYIPWVMAKSYVDVLKDIPPTFPTSNNDYRVEVPGFPVEAIYHVSCTHYIPTSSVAWPC